MADVRHRLMVEKTALLNRPGEVGDLRNYRNAKRVLKMAGLNLFERSSGQQHRVR